MKRAFQKPDRHRNLSTSLRLQFACIAICFCVLQTGCQRRAYNDLYIENMAAEIRDLEDQLYAYDHEYRLLEQELDTLRAENAALQPGTDPTPAPRRPLENFRQRSKPQVPEEIPSGDTPSILDSGDGSSEGELTPPQIEPPTGNPPSNPFPAGNGSGVSFPMDQLVPPTITPGEPMPPPLSARSDQTGRSRSNNALELNLGRIEIPTALASQRKIVGDQKSELELTPADAGARVSAASEEILDTRVVELAFHPTLSRAANFDENTDDDGLYLVVQPKNEAGQVVPIAADLSVVVLDPARDDSQSKIIRKNLSANEVRSKMESKGLNQGIHLTLPWSGPNPIADRVIVFARYTFPDGRQVIGEKTLFVSADGGIKTVWAPRSRSPEPANASVRTASATLPAESLNSGPHRSTDSERYPASTNKVRAVSGNTISREDQSHVVRPSVGSSNASSAPSPSFQPRTR